MNLLDPPVHVLNHVDQLAVFLIFVLDKLLELAVVLLEFFNQLIALLELLLDCFELDRVSKGVFRPHNVLKLLSEAGALLDIHLYLRLDLLQLCAANILFQSLDLIHLLLVIDVEIFNLALQIDD